MTGRAKVLKALYRRGRVTIEGLKKAVIDGTITAAEYEDITGEDHGA